MVKHKKEKSEQDSDHKHKEQKHEHNVHKRHSKHATHGSRKEHCHLHTMSVVSLVVLIVGVLMILFALSYYNKAKDMGSGMKPSKEGKDIDNVFFYLTSSACTTNCDAMEKMAMDAAKELGFTYRNVKLPAAPNLPDFPLYFTIKEDQMTDILPVQDKAVFGEELCNLGAESVCGQAEVLKAEALKAELEASKNACNNATKYDDVVFESWVVSLCPFGVQTLNGLVSVVDLLKDEEGITITPRYLISEQPDGTLTAMHGEEEYAENLRHVCLREEQPDVFCDYVKCYVETRGTDACEITASVDSAMLTECIDNRVDDYMQEELARQKEVGNPSGSPTNMINGERISEFDFGGRSPEGLKSTICCSLENKPIACSTGLVTAQPPRGFGVINGDSVASADQVTCG